MSQKILLVMENEFEKCPRARRLFMALAARHQVKHICRPLLNENNQAGNLLWHLNKNLHSPLTRKLVDLAIKFNLLNFALGYKSRCYDVGNVKDGDFDYIFVYQLYLLPHFIEFKKTKVIFDARECYPLQLANNKKWLSTHGKLAEFACKKLIPKVYKTTTVSPSLQTYYQALTGRKPELFPSYPHSSYRVTAPDKAIGTPIRLIHHGSCDRKRELHQMIELMQLLGSNFQLDLMLVYKPGNSYIEELKLLVDKTDNVQLIDAVSPEKIIKTTMAYDLGLFLLPDNGSQNKYALPNKYFEFLYAGLPVITSGSIDMKMYTDKYGFGLSFLNESLQEIADHIKHITKDDIEKFKRSIDKEVSFFTVEENIKQCLPELI